MFYFETTFRQKKKVRDSYNKNFIKGFEESIKEHQEVPYQGHEK